MPRHTTVLPDAHHWLDPVASKPGDLDKVSQKRWCLRGKRQVRTMRSSNSISVEVKAASAGACGAHRLFIVSQNMRQLRMQNTAIRFASRSAGRSFESSSLHSDLRILWNG
jgi:hypothetical protein